MFWGFLFFAINTRLMTILIRYRKEVIRMLMFLAMLLVVLIGVALAIFGVVATLAGLLWLLWPLMIIVGIFILIGYSIGKKKGKPEKDGKAKEEPVDAEFKEVKDE